MHKGDSPMKRMTSLFAVLVLAAIVAVVPVANAQKVHFLGAGYSAMFQGIGVSGYNDVALRQVLTSTQCTGSGITCTAGHWSLGSNVADIGVTDSRASVPEEPGSF